MLCFQRLNPLKNCGLVAAIQYTTKCVKKPLPDPALSAYNTVSNDLHKEKLPK